MSMSLRRHRKGSRLCRRYALPRRRDTPRLRQILHATNCEKLSDVFLRLKALLEPFGLTRYYTDSWGAYTRHLAPDEPCPGKRHTQQIERKHLTLRTRMKRLARKTLCFSKTTQMHDIVLGLFVNRYAFGRAV